MKKIKKSKIEPIPIVITMIILILLLIISLSLYKYFQKNKDIHKDKNLLLGSWIYNEYNGTYVFNEDYTFIQYTNSDTKDNYCTGTYKYTYGIQKDKGITIRHDDNYYYYSLTLNINECLIMKKQVNEKYTKKMYFGISKNNNFNEILLANSETENILKLTKTN